MLGPAFSSGVSGCNAGVSPLAPGHLFLGPPGLRGAGEEGRPAFRAQRCFSAFPDVRDPGAVPFLKAVVGSHPQHQLFFFFPLPIIQASNCRSYFGRFVVGLI